MATQNKDKAGKKGAGRGAGKDYQPREQIQRPPPPDIRMQVGIVRAVISGDTVSILETDDTTPHRHLKEILFTFLGLKAPQLGRRTPEGQTKDKEFAWQSREFLRKLVIGKPVVYRLEHESDFGGRHYGELWSHEEIDLRLEIVNAGWAEVITKPRKAKDGSDLELSNIEKQLEKAQEEAKSKKRGIWSSNQKEAIRRVKIHEAYRDSRTDVVQTDELFEFYKGVKDKEYLNGIVEAVKTGTSLTIILPETMDQFPLMLAGVRSPSIKNDEADPFAREAKFFTEYILLHRDVKVHIESMDKYNLYGTVILGDDLNISLNLLQMGLASFVEWSAPKDATTIAAFKQAEKEAQEKRRRMWCYHSPLSQRSQPKQGGKDTGKITKETVFTGKVVEIVNAGTITVRVSKSDSNNTQKTVDRIITFSSIRPPRVLKPAEEEEETQKKGAKEQKNLTPEQLAQKTDFEKKKKEEEEELKREAAYAQEAREFLRNILIGQKVRCVFDYPRSNRPLPHDKNPPQVKLYWSVYVTEGNTEKNVAVELVKQGYAKVISHPEDELRATDYQDLIVAEKAAESASKGLHGPVYRKPNHLINDLTPPPQTKNEKSDKPQNQKQGEGEETKSKRKTVLAKCRQFFSFLQRQSKVEAIVDYVFAASRYKLSIPSNSCVIMFTLQGCIVERPEKSTEQITVKPDISIFDKQYPPDKPGNKALHFARDNVFQRKVQVTITALDVYGNFLGQLFINNKDFTLTLIEHGHARLQYKTARKLPLFDKYEAAEKVARESLKGLWATFDFEAETKAKEAAFTRQSTQSGDKEVIPIAVTDIRSGSQFSYQILNEETNSLNELSANLQNEKFAKQPEYVPKRGEIVAGQFTADDQWYRAQVIGDNKSKGSKDEAILYDVRYIDYGNRESIPQERIRFLEEEYCSVLKPQAHDAKLIWVKAPIADSDFGRDSLEGLKELVWGKSLYAQEVYKEKITTKDQKEPQYLHHVLVTDEEKTSINLEMISRGYARVEKKRDDSEPLLSTYREAQEYARESRLGIWQYGDYPDSDEERELERNLLR